MQGRKHRTQGTGKALRPAILMCFGAGGLYGWSALIAPLQARFGVTTAEAGFVFSIAIVAFSLAVFAAPHGPAYLNGQRGTAVFGVIGALALCMAATASSYALFVLWFSGGFGAMSGAIYISTLRLAAASATPNRATPIMVAAFGLGGVVFGPVWRMIGDDWGLYAILPLALILGGVSIWSYRGATPEATPSDTAATMPVHKTRPPLRLILAIWCVFAFGSVAGLMVLGLASKIIDIAGGSVWLGSLTLAGIALGNTGGRLSVVGICAAMRPIFATFISVGFLVIGLVLCAFVTAMPVVACGLVLIALGYGIMASAIPTILSDAFGEVQFSRIFPIVFTAWGTAGLVAPWSAGAIVDQTGHFLGAIYLALGATLISGLAAVVLWRWLKPLARQSAFSEDLRT
ncbi:hypothetical protein N9L47_10535 [Rhodobacteraceae bacterium]|nr:hypothetical protein [Paracoccaceae bacterium]